MTPELTDREILEACARAMFGDLGQQVLEGNWNPLLYGNDGASMENKCGVSIRPEVKTISLGWVWECYTPGNDEERRRASCLVVARAQLAKEKE